MYCGHSTQYSYLVSNDFDITNLNFIPQPYRNIVKCSFGRTAGRSLGGTAASVAVGGVARGGRERRKLFSLRDDASVTVGGDSDRQVTEEIARGILGPRGALTTNAAQLLTAPVLLLLRFAKANRKACGSLLAKHISAHHKEAGHVAGLSGLVGLSVRFCVCL